MVTQSDQAREPERQKLSDRLRGPRVRAFEVEFCKELEDEARKAGEEMKEAHAGEGARSRRQTSQRTEATIRLRFMLARLSTYFAGEGE